MRALEIIPGHVIYNPAYTYKFQLKTTHVTLKGYNFSKSNWKQPIYFKQNNCPISLILIQRTEYCQKAYGNIKDWYYQNCCFFNCQKLECNPEISN